MLTDPEQRTIRDVCDTLNDVAEALSQLRDMIGARIETMRTYDPDLDEDGRARQAYYYAEQLQQLNAWTAVLDLSERQIRPFAEFLRAGADATFELGGTVPEGPETRPVIVSGASGPVT